MLSQLSYSPNKQQVYQSRAVTGNVRVHGMSLASFLADVQPRNLLHCDATAQLASSTTVVIGLSSGNAAPTRRPDLKYHHQ